MGFVPPKIVPPSRKRWEQSQLKEGHPMQETWDQVEEYQQSTPPHSGSVIAPPCECPDCMKNRTEYGGIVPPIGRGGIKPIPRVDPDLIGEEYR